MKSPTLNNRFNEKEKSIYFMQKKTTEENNVTIRNEYKSIKIQMISINIQN